MAVTQEVLQKLKAAYQEWDRSKGDNTEQWFDLLDDGLDFRSLAHAQTAIPWAVNCTSLDQVRGYLDGLTSAFKMDYYKVERFVRENDTVVVIAETAWTNRATGKHVKTPKVDIWRFNVGGKATAFHEYYDTAGLLQASLP